MRRARWKAHEGAVRCLAISRDEATLASGGDDGKAKLWAYPGGAPAKELAGPPARGAEGAPGLENPVLAAAFSAGGEIAHFITHAGEATAYLVASGELAWRAPPIERLGGKVGIAAVASDRGLIALGRHTSLARRSLTGAADESILLYSLDERRVIGELSWSAQVGRGLDRITHSIGFTPDGSTLALAGLEAAFDIDGDWLGYTSYAAVFQTDPVTEKGILYLDSDHAPPWGVRRAIAIHPSGTHIGLAGTSEVRGAEHTYTLGDREVVAAAQLKPPGHYEDGFGGNDRDEPFRHLGTLDAEPTAIAFSPDGSLLAMADAAGAAVASWMEGASGYLDALGCDAGVTSVLFSPTGRSLIYGRADGTIEIVRIP
jgi:hypothetical protein